MREMKASGVEWIGDIPVNWKVQPAKTVFYESKEKTVEGDERLTPSQRFGVVAQKRYMELMNSKVVLAEKGLENWKHVIPNDFIISLRSFQGGLEMSEITGCVTWHYIVLRSMVPVAHRYYKYLFKSSRYIAALQTTCDFIRDGQDLRYSNFVQVPLPVPPMSDQVAIAAFLDNKCAEIDRAIEAAEASIEEYKLYKKSVIFQAVTKGLDPDAPMKDSGIEWIGEMPFGWSVIRAKQLFSLTNGRGNDTPVLLAATQKYGMYPQHLLEGVVRVQEGTDINQFKTVHVGDFVISLRSFQGGFERSDYEGVCSPAYQTFAATGNICSQYFKHLFKSHGFIDEMNSLTLGIREGKTIKFQDFANSWIPVPPLEEQKVIADWIDRKTADIDAAALAKWRIIEDLKSYKKSLIFEAVTGKREVPCL